MPFAAEKEVKIGVLYPLSGALATIGRDLQRAAELTADLVNNKNPEVDMLMAKWGGSPNLGGAKLKLIFADHRGEPDRGADLAKRLIQDDKVAGLMGAYNSSVTKTVSAVAESHEEGRRRIRVETDRALTLEVCRPNGKAERFTCPAGTSTWLVECDAK